MQQYQVGDILLCHKHIGITKFVGKLHKNDYSQLSLSSQQYIKESDIWVGLQLAEKSNVPSLAIMKPHEKHRKSLQAITYSCFKSIPYLDYFTSKYGLLVPIQYVHKKINKFSLLDKLTQLFHSFKQLKSDNEHLSKKIKEISKRTSKKVKSKSEKSLESIIYDKNGNSYHHHQKITHTTTHSFKSSPPKSKSNSPNNKIITQKHNTSTVTAHDDDSSCDADDADEHDADEPHPDDTANVSQKAINDNDNFSDRNMSDNDDDNVDEPPVVINDDTTTNIKNNTNNTPKLTAVLSHHTFNPEHDIINEDDEEDYNINQMNDLQQRFNQKNKNRKRYSDPWNRNKLSMNEFGSDYDKINDNYWKLSGNRNINNINANNNANMLPMLQNDPTANRIYKIAHIQQKGGTRHKKSVSMDVVKGVPRYFFEIDNEFPDLPI